MQVTHVQDHVTHAVIGGKEAMSFGMSDSAEFFNILSNTLYSDKPLAVVREVLCNAWDAHIQSNRTHLPVVVTLTGEKLIIRDYGTGIPKGDMHQVYCVYGNSTKKNDGNQTGGFGLGCKAPFAYTDHFEVVSMNGGVKTIYRISKSSGEVGGRPGMMELVSVPTDEHGLQVTIDLKSEKDIWTFKPIIERIARIGEMNVTINGDKVPTIAFSKAKHDFLVTDVPINQQGQNHHRILVRYGNVAYPVDEHEAYADVYRKTRELLGLLGRTNIGQEWRLVLLAKPNTISVTPSRESLSMTDFTIETLRSLLENFNTLRTKEMKIQTLRAAKEGVESTVQAMHQPKLLDAERHVLPSSKKTQLKGFLTDFDQISRVYVSTRYPEFHRFRERDITFRLRALIASGFGNRGLIQSYLRAYTKEEHCDAYHSNWLQRRLVAPLVMGLKAELQLAPSRLLIYGRHEDQEGGRRRFKYAENEFTVASKFHREDLEACLPFLRNTVILAYNRTDVEERAPAFPEMRWLGRLADNLVYMVQRSDPKVEAARAFFKARGFYVLDLTRRAKWEPITATDSVEVREYKPRKKGIPVLSCVMPTADGRISTDRAKLDDVERIEAPEFVIKIAARNDFNFFGDFHPETSKDIVQLFGSKGGIVVNDSQATKYQDLGAKPAADWILNAVQTEIRQNSRIHAYLKVDPDQLASNKVWSSLDHDQRETLRLILKDPALYTHFNVGHEMTADDFRFLRIWRWYEQKHRSAWNIPKEIADFTKYLGLILPTTEVLQLMEQLQSSKLIGFLNKIALNDVLRTSSKNTEATRQQQAKARDLVIWAVKG